MENNLMIFLINLIFYIKFVANDCGLPSIPFNTQINKVKYNYLENETVEYRCELDGLTLVGHSRRCWNNQWVGAIPRCLEELDSKSIETIELIGTDYSEIVYNTTNTTILMNESVPIFHSAYNQNKCLEINNSINISETETLKLNFVRNQSHITYIELLILDKYNDLGQINVANLIRSAKLFNRRKCLPKLIHRSAENNTLRVGLFCSIEYFKNFYSMVWKRDQTYTISIGLINKKISICEIKVYKKSNRPYHWCGSADIVRHSTRKFIRNNQEYSGNSHYRYKCNEGFQLIGNRDVRCGIDNDWIDKFPVCKPTITCQFPPSNHSSINVDINRHHLFRFNDSLVAVFNAYVWYTCAQQYIAGLSVMIGDSVRICDEDGQWFGLAPICIHSYEINSFADYIKDLDKEFKAKEFELIETIERKESVLSCGIPAMPALAKPITYPENKYGNRHADIRPIYPNQTVIEYQCESAHLFVSGNVGRRVCLNGKWTGKLDNYAINLGNRISLESIDIFKWNQHGHFVNYYIEMIDNSSNKTVDNRFVFRRQDINECPTFYVDQKQRWTLRLNKSVRITSLTVILYPGGILGGTGIINDRDILKQTPVSVVLGNTLCELAHVNDDSREYHGTNFYFDCDLEKPDKNYTDQFKQIDINIDPQLFNQNFTSKNISFCYLSVFTSAQDCGTPDIPIHGSAVYNKGKREWMFSCEQGYELNGPSIVRCEQNNRWYEEFPICQKQNVCQLNQQSYSYLSVMKYNKSLIRINDKDIAVMNACLSTQTNRKILIGPRIRICTSDGQWSGTDSFCEKLNKITTTVKGQTQSKDIVLTAIVVAIVCIFLLIVIIISIRYKQLSRAKNKIRSPFSSNSETSV